MSYQLSFKLKPIALSTLRNCDKPRLIEALKTKRIRDIACGSSHSAAITSSGELYSWGLGEYGRLGHGDNTTQLRPKLVCVKDSLLPFYCQFILVVVFEWLQYPDPDVLTVCLSSCDCRCDCSQVKVLLGHRVIQVACGSRDAQTLALTDEGHITMQTGGVKKELVCTNTSSLTSC